MALGSPPTLSVIVMAFDEAGSLASTVDELLAELARLGVDHEILIVDDGSSDGTGELADRIAAAQPQVHVLHHTGNQGLGGVYRSGFRHARGELLTFFPADGQYPASIIGQYLPRMEGHDVLLGCLPQGRGSLLGHALSIGERLIYRLLFGSFPRFQGILMFRRALLDKMELRSAGRGWAVLMEFILRASRSGARLGNVPITVRARTSGGSKVNNLRTIWSNLRQVIALRRHL